MSDYITEKTLQYDVDCPVNEDNPDHYCKLPLENQPKFTIDK